MNIRAHLKQIQSLHYRFAMGVMLVFFALCLLPFVSLAQVDDSYDEISITINVERVGNFDIVSMMHKQLAYLPVKDLFDYLKIKNTLSNNADSVSGFFINPSAPFLIDKNHNSINYLNKIIELKPGDLIGTENNLFLRSALFGEIFGLNCSFNFRALSITLTTNIELPAIRERQLEQMRRNISLLKGEKKADTTIKNAYKLFSFGMADWGLTSTQQSKANNITHAYLGMGALIAGGEATLLLNASSNTPFKKQQQYYKWRLVNNDSKLFKQITLGKLFAQSTASVFAPVEGFQITNTATIYKKSFGSYTLSNSTKPGWTVELYVNNILVDYTVADASGFFTFEVPMIYGNSLIKLRFYGPWGEEETKEQTLNIPFNFLPVGHLEYAVTGGVVGDETGGLFSRANVHYGLSKRLTVGVGVEYLSSLLHCKVMPFATASLRIGSSFLVSAEHTHGVQTKANINYRLPSNLQFNAYYTRYERGQVATRYNYLDEKRATVSMPLRGKKLSAFTRLTVDQYTLLHEKGDPIVKNTSAELLFSAVIKGVSTNLTTNAILNNPKHPSIFSNLSTTVRLHKRTFLTPQIQFDYTKKALSIFKLELERPVSKKAYINCSFVQDISRHTYSAGVGFRYNFSFAQTALNVMGRNGGVTSTQSAKGSFVVDNMGHTQFDDQNNLGRGSILVVPFVDINCNGVRDANEPKAFGLNMTINGGYMDRNDKDTTIRILGLEAYNKYLIELDKGSFDNVAWQLRKQSIGVSIEPNSFKTIEVPVSVIGEVAGYVYKKDDLQQSGLGRIIINIYDQHKNIIARLLSETDGYFNYMGLKPGKYFANIDDAQLSKLEFKASPGIAFTIKAMEEGDVQDGLEFTLEKIK